MADQAKLPTKEEIAKLPRWARVAFAVRCAKRVRPLFRPSRSHEEKSVDEAIQLAETIAADGGRADLHERIREVVRRIWSSDGSASSRAAKAARACAEAATGVSSGAVQSAARAAVGALRRASDVRRDFHHIAATTSSENWTNSSPAPPTSFGPLWPDGAPEWWPATDGETSTLPTREDIEQLPRLTRVAFAVRCAQRARPLYRGDEEEVVDQAIFIATKFAAGAEVVIDREMAKSLQVVIDDAAVKALGETKRNLSVALAQDYERNKNRRAAAAADKAIRSVYAAGAAYAAVRATFGVEAPEGYGAVGPEASRFIETEVDAESSAAAARAAANAAANNDMMQIAIRRDLETMSVASKSHRGATSVPPESFGPLWPNGAPPWWPSDSPMSTINLRFSIPEEADDDIVGEQIGRIVDALSKLHKLDGGSGLQIVDEQSFDTADERVGSPANV